MRKHIVRVVLGLVISLLFILQAAISWRAGGDTRVGGFIAQMEHFAYDARLRLTLRGGRDDRIVILDIDEKSLQELGHWPWSRDAMARIVDKLFEKYHLAVLGFDVVFPEADYSSGIRVLDVLARDQMKEVPRFQQIYQHLRPSLDNDELFAKAIRDRPVVLGFYISTGSDTQRVAALPEPVMPKGTFGARNIDFVRASGYGGNLQRFVANARNSGHFAVAPDFDGVVRRVPMLVELDGAYYEALSVAMIRTMLGLPMIEPGYAPDRFVNKGYSGLEWLQVGPVTIPVDASVSTIVPYRGGKGSFTYISLADVAADRVPVESLKNRIGLIGSTAAGLLDLRSTPVGPAYPGVEVHANLLAGMLDGNLKRRPPYVIGAEIVQLAVSGIALALLVPLLPAMTGTLTAAGMVLLITGLNLGVWIWADTIIPLASALLMVAAIYVVNMAYGYFFESRSKRQFADLFGQYVPPELVDQMAQDPEKYDMQGREEVLTVLFSDIRGFTSISESLSARDLSLYINEYLTAMSLIIREHGGTLDKYIGDAIMAFWGAPVSDAAHARRAVLTALAMQRRAEQLSADFQAKGWPACRIGVGVNSGLMRVGDMGSKLRKAYTVMGDAVNLGSRLEGVTKQYGVGILVGESTRKSVSDVIFREVDRVRVKGKDEAVAIYEPLGREGEVGKSLLDESKLWNQFLRQYRAQDWDGADVTLVNIRRGNPDSKFYAIYADRVAEYRRQPPGPAWDGVMNFETK